MNHVIYHMNFQPRLLQGAEEDGGEPMNYPSCLFGRRTACLRGDGEVSQAWLKEQ